MRGCQAGGRVRAKQQRQEALARYAANPKYCEHCKARIEVKEHQKVTEMRRRRYCSRHCAIIVNNTISPKRKASPFRSCKGCGVPIPKRRRWGYSTVQFCDKCRGESYTGLRVRDRVREDVRRQTIQKHAQRVYALSGKPYDCVICGYDKHIEVSHIKGVASFPPDTYVRDINALDNLVALCPNHHWEFDRGLLELPKKAG